MRYMIQTYHEIDDLYNELYDSLIKANKYLKDKIVENALLHEKVKQLDKENHDLNVLAKRFQTKNKICSKCESYKAKNDELSKALQGFTNSKNGLNDMLNN